MRHKCSITRAKETARRECSRPIRVEDYDYFYAGKSEVLIFLFSYLQKYPDEELKPERVYRYQLFVDGRLTAGGFAGA